MINKTNSKPRLTFALFALLAFCVPLAAQQNIPILERQPPNHHEWSTFHAAIESMEHRLVGMPSKGLASRFKIWVPGSTVTVAFRGGDAGLYKKIESAAGAWMKHANIKLEFTNPQTGKYRLWSAQDTSYASDIRIGFAEKGYWSCVGTDSRYSKCAAAGQPSMNLQGFDVTLPLDYKETVLHEFGHALALEHEHQHPDEGCDQEFRWDDDPGYELTEDQHGQRIRDSKNRRPGLYTLLEGAPNKWPRADIDTNLRQYAQSGDFELSTFDDKSVMLYKFETWMFKKPDSRCCKIRDAALSAQDKSFISRLYPSAPAAVKNLKQEQIQMYEALRDSPEFSGNESLEQKLEVFNQP
jgi:hypothetical protein